MYRINVIVLFLTLNKITRTSCRWLDGLNKGLDVGYGITLNENHKENNNTLLLETKSARLNYNGIEFSINKLMNDNEIIEVDIYFNEKDEGRSKKIGELLLPTIIGMKLTVVTLITFVSVVIFVLKALTITKFALLSAVGLLIMKVFFHRHSHFNDVEGLQQQQQQNINAEYQPNYYMTQGVNEGNYFNYHNFYTNKDAIGKSNGQFASVIPIVELVTNKTNGNVNTLQITKRSNDTLRGINNKISY